MTGGREPVTSRSLVQHLADCTTQVGSTHYVHILANFLLTIAIKIVILSLLLSVYIVLYKTNSLVF